MLKELYIMGLQYPRKNERVVLKLYSNPLGRSVGECIADLEMFLDRQADQVQSEDIHISDADISIVQNTITGRYRLIIISRNGCSILSQECKFSTKLFVSLVVNAYLVFPSGRELPGLLERSW
jgi:hypothetical protein